MPNHQVEVNLYLKASVTIHLKGSFFFGETQHRLTGEWKVNVRDNKLYIESEEQILISNEEVVLSPVFEEDCGFKIIDNQQNSDHEELCNFYMGNLIICKNSDVVLIRNQVDIESFVRNILCHQFAFCKYIEFLKVQAVILRSAILNLSKKEGLLSSNKKEIFPLLRNRSQLKIENLFFDTSKKNLVNLYQGFPKKCNEIAHDAVTQTCGMVLVCNDELYCVSQTICCGGLTGGSTVEELEDSECNMNRVCDTYQYTAIDLSSLQNLEQWIYYPEQCYCSTEDIGLINQLKLEQTDHKIMLFRWNDVLSSVKISSVLRNRLNINCGKVEGLEVVDRSVSGVTKCILVKGDNGKVYLKGDGLCKFINGNNLQSATFLVDSKRDVDTGEISFTFNGAGTGSGEGLCQVGALYLAKSGERMETILQHYFKGVYIEKQY